MDFAYPNALPSTGRDAWPPAIRAGDRASNNSHWQEGLNLNHNSGAVTVSGGAHAYAQGNLFNASELPQGECLGGVGSDSGCALSLLSTTQPWGNHTAGNATPTIALSSGGFDGSSMAPPPPMNVVGNYETGPWGFRVHGTRSGSHEMPHEVGQFSGELELALQGNGPHLDHGSSRGFEPSGHGMNWSL